MTPVKISGNGGYSWWTRPVFLQVPSGNIYFTAISDTPKWRAFLNSSATYVDLDDCPERDDHNAPSILVSPNKPRLAFATRHNASQTVNRFRALSGIAFSDLGNLTHPGDVTYSQVLNSGDRVIVLSRVDSWEWRFFESANWGTSWGASEPFMDFGEHNPQLYMLATPSSTAGVYHLAAYGHPVNSDYRGMVYGTVDLTNGNISNAAGVVGNLDGTNLPLAVEDFDDIAPTTGTERARMFDVGEAHGLPVILYAKWDDEEEVPAGYWMAYRDGEGWHHVDLETLAGVPFWEPSRYLGGMSVDKNGNDRLFLAREDSGTWHVEMVPIDEDMTLGDAVTVATDGTYPLVRPYAVEHGDGVVWQRLIAYTKFSSYHLEYWIEDDFA